MDVLFKDESYAITITTNLENHFYLHAAYFEVNGAQITKAKYLRKIYKTAAGRDKKSDKWLNQT